LGDIQSLAAVFDSPATSCRSCRQNVGSATLKAPARDAIVPTDNLLFNVNVGYLDAKYMEISGTFALDTNTAFAQAP
jgi:hypothetical protein